MTRSHRALPPRLLYRGAVFGALFGLGITASEMLVVPMEHYASLDRSVVFSQILTSWILEGILVAWLTFALEPWIDRPWKLAVSIVSAALMVSLVDIAIWGVPELLGLMHDWRRALGEPALSLAHFLYAFWMTLAHGGLFIVACILVMRAERTRLVLGAAQIARDRAEAQVDAAQLNALRGQVDPAFLARAMTAIRDRYAVDAGNADCLLDELVAFLRIAMPGVRSGDSTLATEIALARAYAQIGAAIAPERAAWRIESGAAPPGVPFPPLLLLPLMDALAATHDGVLTLRVTEQTDHLTITLDAPPHAELPAPLRYRTLVALQAAFGEACAVSDPSPSHPAFVIVIATSEIASTAPLHVAPAQGAPLPRPALGAATVLVPGALP